MVVASTQHTWRIVRVNLGVDAHAEGNELQGNSQAKCCDEDCLCGGASQSHDCLYERY